MSRNPRIIVGVDEAGRGPLAGPVALGAVLIEPSLLRKFREIRDSKKLTSLQRDKWFEILSRERKCGNLNFKVAFVGNKVIDEQGISYAVRLGIKRVLTRLELEPEKCKIFLDGLLKAPSLFPYQRTIIGGDERMTIIALASIVAKVLRDRKMTRLSRKFSGYGFEIHKGYGTVLHKRTIKILGPSLIHRATFL